MNRRFDEDQREFFDVADARHFRWQTQNSYVARTERALLESLPINSSADVLEVGCGEGGNIVNLPNAYDTVGRHVVGVDLFEPKLRYAKEIGVRASFVCADISNLPFHDSAFDFVLCRDVLHHVAQPAGAISELRRVCRPGGVVCIIEPNGWNPLMRLLALVRPHERGILRNSTTSLRSLVSLQFPRVQMELKQPMPVFRLLLHYQFGFPGLGDSRTFAFAMDAWDALAQRVIPRAFWAYVVIAADV